MEQKPVNVDAYIESLQGMQKERLIALRALLRSLQPEAEEVISYSMPAFRQGVIVLWYKASANHYSIYPYAKTIEHFKEQLKGYSLSKGTVRFAYSQVMPEALIRDIVHFRLEEIGLKIPGRPKTKKQNQ